MATDGNEPPGHWAGVLSYRINTLLSLPGFYNKTCVWITFPSSLLPREVGCCSISPRLQRWKCNQYYQKGCFWKAGTGLGCQPRHWAAAGLQVPVWPLHFPGNILQQKASCSPIHPGGWWGQALHGWCVLPQGGESCLGDAGTWPIFSFLCYLGKGPWSSRINWSSLPICCYLQNSVTQKLAESCCFPEL